MKVHAHEVIPHLHSVGTRSMPAPKFQPRKWGRGGTRAYQTPGFIAPILRGTLHFVALIVVWLNAVATPAGWSTNLTAAMSDAKKRQQPVLLYFTASWCAPCKLMARTTLTNAAVMDALTNIAHVALDIDEFPTFAQQHAVQGVPTFAMLTPASDEVARIVGYREAEDFVRWLTNSAGESRAAITHRKEVEQRLAAAAQLAQGANPDASRKAARELFDLCAEQDTATGKAATAALKKLAERDPAVLLDGLNHPRLAARIAVANLLRGQLGEDFNVDPWSDAPARQKGVSAWRERLANKPAR